MRNGVRALLTLGLLLVCVGTTLGTRCEARIEVEVEGTVEEVLAGLDAALADPENAPWSEGRWTQTAATEHGRWFEVEDPARKSAALVEPLEGGSTRVIWSEVEHYGWNPVRALWCRIRVMGQREERLLRAVESLYSP